jgi:RNA polymerase sigma factor (sigma-70 family)
MGAEFDLNRLRADLVAYLRRKDRGGEEAEDVAQEAFARFHRSGHDVTTADARPLMFVIAKHIQLDRWKAAGREARRNALEDVYDLDSGPHALASPAPRADQQLIDRQNLAAAAAAIRALPPKTRDAFLLHRFEGLTYRQIAGRLGISVSMVEKHIAEALRQLKTSRGD